MTPTVADLNLTLSQGEVLIDAPFKAADADYDLLSFTVLDGPDHGELAQETRFDGNFYPFHQGHYFTSLHYHADFLSGNLFDYTPDAGFIGTDSFTVVATDGQGNSNVATITITVTPPAQAITLTDASNVVSYAPTIRRCWWRHWAATTASAALRSTIRSTAAPATTSCLAARAPTTSSAAPAPIG